MRQPLIVLLFLSLFVTASSGQSPVIEIPAAPHARQAATSTVMPTHPLSTDTSNLLGTVDKPRKTIPNPVLAGTIVDVIGAYGTSHSSPNTLRINGTVAAPVVIRGGSPAAAASAWEVTGSHYTIENFRFSGMILIAPNLMATIQFNEFTSGNPAACGGLGVEGYDGVSWNRDITIYRNHSHHNGDVNAAFDQDCHGFHVGERADGVWIEENILHHNSGDGLQINAGAGKHALTKRIFVARNSAYENKQSGFWSKQASDVVFWRNKAWNHRPSNSSPGSQMGGQYGPEHLWFIENEMWGGDFGIRIASDIGDGSDGQYIFIIDNFIHDITDTDGNFDVNNLWSDCAISIAGGTYRYVMRNRLQNVKSGICHASTSPYKYVFESGSTLSGLLGGTIVAGVLTPVGPATTQALIDYFLKRYPRDVLPEN